VENETKTPKGFTFLFVQLKTATTDNIMGSMRLHYFKGIFLSEMTEDNIGILL